MFSAFLASVGGPLFRVLLGVFGSDWEDREAVGVRTMDWDDVEDWPFRGV